MRRAIIAAMFMLAIIGIANASFLTYKHYEGVPPPCTLRGCETVTSSKYAVIYGVPVSLLGVVFYLAVTLVLGSLWRGHSERMKRILWLLAAVGIIASLYFLYLQLFVIGAICIYCVTSALDAFLLLAGTLVYTFIARRPAGNAI